MLIINKKLLNEKIYSLIEAFDITSLDKTPKSISINITKDSIIGYRTINIKDTIIEVTNIIDIKNKTIDAAFTDNEGTENLTNLFMANRVISNVMYHTVKFLELVNKKLFEKNIKFTIYKVVIFPKRLEGEENLMSNKTKRGKIYKIFIEKYLNYNGDISYGKDKIEFVLKNKIILGENEQIDKSNFNFPVN